MQPRNLTIDSTTVYCPRCHTSHDAVIEREGDRIFGSSRCPAQSDRVMLSGDADLFLALRSKSLCVGLPKPASPKALLSILPITDTCSFRCPICFADSSPQQEPLHLSRAAIITHAREAKSRGSKAVSLSGGEPTLHPEVTQIIRDLSALGLQVDLITNGLRLGTDPGFAKELRRAGLRKVKLQFDSFDPSVHERIRGNRFIEEKKAAARNSVAAGLRLGTVTTVTKLNLGEIGRIVEFGLSFAPALRTIVFQAAAPVGRFNLDHSTLVDKECIVRQLVDCGVVDALSLDDVWPLPRVAPWGLRIHPDCGVNILLSTNKDGRHRLIQELVDIPGLHRRLAHIPLGGTWLSRNLAPMCAILASVHPGKRHALMRGLAGFLFGRGGHGLVVIGIGAFCTPDFLDEQRLAGCATIELTAHGAVSPCACHFGRTS